MQNKLAKLKYLPNNFEIIEEGDHVICSISGKKILLENKANCASVEPVFSGEFPYFSNMDFFSSFVKCIFIFIIRAAKLTYYYKLHQKLVIN